MKRIFPLLSAMALMASADAAQIMMAQMFITSADNAGFRMYLPLNPDHPVGANIEWYGLSWTGPFNTVPTSWNGLGGGEILIITDPGETVLGGSLTAGNGGSYALEFSRTTNIPGSQWWHVYDPSYYGLADDPFWKPIGVQPHDPLLPVYFEIETTSGTFGQQYYVAPEPTSVCLAGIGALALGLRRRR